MRVELDTPQPIEKLRKVYRDNVTFITDTTSYPLVTALEFKGDFLSAMKKRAVPVRVGKKVDKAISKYEKRLTRAWNKNQNSLLYSLKSSITKDVSLSDIVNERDPYQRAKLYREYLLDHKGEILNSNMDELKEDLRNAAALSFLSVYMLGKNRGQILTHQELSDDVTKEDREILDEKEEWNEEYLAGLTAAVLANIDEVLEDEYSSPEELESAIGQAYHKEQYRLPLFAAAVGSVLLAAGMAQAAKEVRAEDPETGEPLDTPKLDPDTDLPIGAVITGGIWRTSHDDAVCDGCEGEDGKWMTWDEFEQEAGTNDCLTRCRCIELFEPTEEQDEKAVESGDVQKVTSKEVDAAADETDTSPTKEQKESGNYKKGHISLHGLDISIENPRGSTRSGTSRDGKRWSVEMKHHYGYIKSTKGGDGEQVDIFIGPNPESEKVFIVDQIVPNTGKFDEHKVMLGFNSSEEASIGYLANYDKDWDGMGALTPMSLNDFKEWVTSRDAKKPVSDNITKGGAGSGSWEGQGQPRFSWNPQNREQQAGGIAQQISERARQVEPKITNSIDRLAQTTGGVIRGREWRLKRDESLVRKVNEEWKANPSLSSEDVANEIRDSVRYTLEFSDDKYTQNINESLTQLQKEGHTPLKVKNYWEQGDPYQGINVSMRSPEGHLWELQFHTPKSYTLKQNELHPIYEQFRVTPNTTERQSLYNKMVQMANMVAAPVGVLAIGTLSRQLMKAVAEGMRYFAIRPNFDQETSGLIRLQNNKDGFRIEYLSNKGFWEEDLELVSFLMGYGAVDEIDDKTAGKFLHEWRFTEKVLKGGVGSGNHGHAGRPGMRGGSAPEGVSTGESKETISNTPRPKVVLGIPIRYSETDYNPENSERHQIIESRIQDELKLIPEEHRSLVKEIVIDDDISNNELMDGQPALPEFRGQEEYIVAYNEYKSGVIVFNASVNEKTYKEYTYAQTLLHEVGHSVSNEKIFSTYLDIKHKDGPFAAKEWYNKTWRDDIDALAGTELLRNNEQSSSAQERASGLYRVYIKRGQELKQQLPLTYNRIKNEWFGGKEYIEKIIKQDDDFRIYDYVLPNGVRVYFTQPQPQLEVERDIIKGGPGSGSWDGPGQPRFAHNPSEKPDIGRDTPLTSTPGQLKTFNGVKNHLSIGTKVILSAERAHLSPSENERRNIALKRILENYDENVVAQEGNWGGAKETSYVASVSIDAVKEIQDLAFASNELDQDAFIVINDGVAELRFRDGKSQRGAIENLSDASEEKDNYSRLGNVKYRINFSENR